MQLRTNLFAKARRMKPGKGMYLNLRISLKGNLLKTFFLFLFFCNYPLGGLSQCCLLLRAEQQSCRGIIARNQNELEHRRTQASFLVTGVYIFHPLRHFARCFASPSKGKNENHQYLKRSPLMSKILIDSFLGWQLGGDGYRIHKTDIYYTM